MQRPPSASLRKESRLMHSIIQACREEAISPSLQPVDENESLRRSPPRSPTPEPLAIRAERTARLTREARELFKQMQRPGLDALDRLSLELRYRIVTGSFMRSKWL